jgi:hypothetical protein
MYALRFSPKERAALSMRAKSLSSSDTRIFAMTPGYLDIHQEFESALRELHVVISGPRSGSNRLPPPVQLCRRPAPLWGVPEERYANHLPTTPAASLGLPPRQASTSSSTFSDGTDRRETRMEASDSTRLRSGQAE